MILTSIARIQSWVKNDTQVQHSLPQTHYTMGADNRSLWDRHLSLSIKLTEIAVFQIYEICLTASATAFNCTQKLVMAPSQETRADS